MGSSVNSGINEFVLDKEEHEVNSSAVYTTEPQAQMEPMILFINKG